MKNIIFAFILTAILFNCNTSRQTTTKTDNEPSEALVQNDTVKIENEELEYQIIIIDVGFFNWLNSIARPEGYYSQQFMENRNRIYVIEWNQRVIQPQRFDPTLYEWRIDYDPMIDYGYEVNYKLYNYFIYFQRRYKQRLGPFIPRI